MRQVLYQAAGHSGGGVWVHCGIYSSHVAVGVPVPEASAPFAKEDVLEQGDGEPKGSGISKDVFGRRIYRPKYKHTTSHWSSRTPTTTTTTATTTTTSSPPPAPTP